MKKYTLLFVSMLLSLGGYAAAVQGTVVNMSSAPVANQIVHVTDSSSNGEYHFYCVTASAGDLLVKAALLSSNSSYWSYLPTYKENSLTWNTAHAASFTLGANNIHMVAGTNPGGPGFIGGSVLL